MKEKVVSKIVTPAANVDLRNQNSYFGGWPVLKDTPGEYAIVMSFPVEGWEGSVSVVVAQHEDGSISTTCHGENIKAEDAINQALATLSLDIDDKSWEQVGKQDSVIGELQKKYDYLRPVLFHSPYEAAAAFIIGQRISVKQRQALQKKMAEMHGAETIVQGNSYFAFPSPQVLLDIQAFPGLNEAKLKRLHGIAQAALEGGLDRKRLLGMSTSEALAYLQSLDGIGPFYASGILYRGAGIVDDITDDSLTKYAIQQAYHLPSEPTQEEVLKIAENWRPYRMWAEVLIHIWLRREVGLPRR